MPLQSSHRGDNDEDLCLKCALAESVPAFKAKVILGLGVDEGREPSYKTRVGYICTVYAQVIIRSCGLQS